MLKHSDFVETSNQYFYKSVPVETLDREIEDYLDLFMLPLIGKVYFLERTKMRTDLRLRIEQVVIAYQGTGISRREAIAKTLNQFRESTFSASAMSDEWKSNHLEPFEGTAKLPLRLALRRFGATAVLTYLALFAFMFKSHLNSDYLFPSLLFAFFAPPLVAGVSIGFRNANRSIRTVFKAHLILALPAILLSVLPVFASYESSLLQVLVIAGWWLGTSLFSGILGLGAGKWLKRTDLLDRFAPPAKTPQATDRLF